MTNLNDLSHYLLNLGYHTHLHLKSFQTWECTLANSRLKVHPSGYGTDPLSAVSAANDNRVELEALPQYKAQL